ncbi:hypothetical protein TCAL_09254 [Tigriopus californicus]|uniref:G-protein coupled receptors family 1 profile domain-containing protein n=1 Tax=Tigriopus californicus TaxID=6832 RepID=A0A553N8K2_TIGCA|nr:hypothetical protein TCAL_09254 [Tigriopus californicus]|eukprot:TCALIF_09254-PA protein Name:"Protein of unknown function" AED:0.48 eAED:1.00 QI:0/-1/0/1/-1/1/1/0/347
MESNQTNGNITVNDTLWRGVKEPMFPDEPPELIIARVLFALLVSVALVFNLLLLLAVVRRRKTVHVIYCFTAAMIIPDLIFYCKLVAELMDWDALYPSWSENGTSCAFWQYGSHIYPIMHSVILCAIVYHAFITLFLDYSGGYEENCRKYFFLILGAILITIGFLVAPSGIYSQVKTPSGQDDILRSHFKQYCGLDVPSLIVNEKDVSGIKEESEASFRLVYEIVLPYVLPIAFLVFPYISLLIGLMRNVPAASHSEYSTKMTVVATLWLLTSYLMLHVSSVMRNMFSIFSVWHRLIALFDAYDDERVPIFQTYIHILSYVLTCIWAILRPALCFKYNLRLRRALGP